VTIAWNRQQSWLKIGLAVGGCVEDA